MDERKTAKKLTVELTDDHHKRIKRAAIERNLTLRRYVLQTVMERVLKEEILNE